LKKKEELKCGCHIATAFLCALELVRGSFDVLADLTRAVDDAGNEVGAERFVLRFRILSPEMKALMEKASGVPIDIRITYKK
jgi:hypothetical protein